MRALAAPWSLDVQAVAELLGVDPVTGLSVSQAGERLTSVGPNALVTARRRPAVVRLLGQFTNTLSAVLAVAAVVTAAIGDWKDTIVIAAVLVLDATVGFVQEGRAERAVELLRAMSADHCRVRRGGAVSELSVVAVVPGDVLLVEQGDVIPADLRLVEAEGLSVQEAALTGEAVAVAKMTAPVIGDAVPLPERRCMAYKGTAVTRGRGVGVVTATGMNTEIGQIARLLEAHPEPLTPLQVRLAVLGRRLAGAAILVCVAVFFVGLVSGETVHKMFLTAVSLAVAAIPEGLPAVVTVALALGARRMAARQAIIRRLPAVETLGSVTVICTDKTGTLTANAMVVERVWTPRGAYGVSGGGYGPSGDVRLEQAATGVEEERARERDPLLTRCAEVAAACNDATLAPPDAPGGAWRVVGDPTEGALLAFATKVGVEQAALLARCPRRAEIGFDASRRRMVTVHDAEGAVWVAVKGAPAAVLPLLDPGDVALAGEASALADVWARDGLRVLALADRRLPGVPVDLAGVEEGLRLVGLVGMTDPPRAESLAAIASCRSAGITPVMITGDHPLTAAAIAGRLGITVDGHVDTGSELAGLSDAELADRVETMRVFARVSPEQKLRIVRAFKETGAVVAMTGDGVNDAPALRLADIGVAMGVTGTDVSKEAADMVLADDNFATIVAAVEEGRRIYDNIRRVVRYLLSTNSAEILVMIVAPALGLPLPLLPVQILWINLVTDGAPAIALGLEPAEPDVLAHAPRPARASILGRGLWQDTVGIGVAMAAIVLALQAGGRSAGWPWQTQVFTTLALLQLANAWAMRAARPRGSGRGWRGSLWLGVAVLGGTAAQLLLVYLPPLRPVFATAFLGPLQIAVVAAATIVGYGATRVVRRLTVGTPAHARVEET